jgi:hypothetical protein
LLISIKIRQCSLAEIARAHQDPSKPARICQSPIEVTSVRQSQPELGRIVGAGQSPLEPAKFRWGQPEPSEPGKGSQSALEPHQGSSECGSVRQSPPEVV